LHVEFLHD